MTLRIVSVGIAVAAFFAMPAAAQGQSEQPPASESDTIVVTGRRDGGKLLAVDFQRVARLCAECRRMVAEIERAAAPYHTKKREIARDRGMMYGSITSHSRSSGSSGAFIQAPRTVEQIAADQQADRLKDRIPDVLKKDVAELGVLRREVGALTRDFLSQLAPYVVRAAEAERVERRASAVIKLERRASRPRATDVTDAIIRRVDAMNPVLRLPRG